LPAEHIVEGLIDPVPARALAALLDLPGTEISAGWQLPLLWHWVYLLERPASAALGPDGHPRQGFPEPPVPGMRRLFAGGRIWTHDPLRIGSTLRSTLRVARSREVSGRSGGSMTLVTTRRTYLQDGRPAITEEQDIIYREPSPLQAASDDLPATPPEGSVTVPVDEVFLFRFSALTYNAHRIHYDLDYCREDEDYQGLVVHGPLQALLMTEIARRGRPEMPLAFSYFEFRLRSALFLGQGLHVAAADEADAIECSVSDDKGRLTATGTWRTS
jgi:3-methylfumaryl-CoA hydratase